MIETSIADQIIQKVKELKNQQIDKAEITEILRDFGNMVYVMTSCNEDKLGTITIKEGGISYSRPATVKDNLNFINSAWEAATGKLYELGIYVDEDDDPLDVEEKQEKGVKNMDEIRKEQIDLLNEIQTRFAETAKQGNISSAAMVIELSKQIVYISEKQILE